MISSLTSLWKMTTTLSVHQVVLEVSTAHLPLQNPNRSNIRFLHCRHRMKHSPFHQNHAHAVRECRRSHHVSNVAGQGPTSLHHPSLVIPRLEAHYHNSQKGDLREQATLSSLCRQYDLLSRKRASQVQVYLLCPHQKLRPSLSTSNKAATIMRVSTRLSWTN